MLLANHFRKATYSVAAHYRHQCPPDTGLEAAFAGRSNAGKSSAINAITDQSSLARTSKTPGRTRQIVFFTLNDNSRLVDLPGYGYAQVAKSIKAHWDEVLESYLMNRTSLAGLILLMDIRHPLKEYDQMLLQWCAQAQLPAHVLLTKADKLSFGQASNTLRQVSATLGRDYGSGASVQLFSAPRRVGVDEARQQLAHWLHLNDGITDNAA